MHFIKLILVAIVCELLACFGFSSDQDTKVNAIQGKEIIQPVTIIYDEPAEVPLPAAPEKVYVMQI